MFLTSFWNFESFKIFKIYCFNFQKINQILGNSQNKRKVEGEKELWTKETVLMLNPKRNDFSEVVKIPMNEIEHANRGKVFF